MSSNQGATATIKGLRTTSLT